MRPQILITSADVDKLKQKARKLKRESGMQHVEALDVVAKSAGFDHWHHVSESAKTFEPTETAYYFGVIIAMDIKDAMDFRDESGRFVEDDYAYVLCASDLHQALCEALDDDGIPFREKYSEAELKEWAGDDLMNYGFFRFSDLKTPASVDDVMKIVRECSFWPPQYIWFKGTFQESPSDQAIDDDGEVVGVHF